MRLSINPDRLLELSGQLQDHDRFRLTDLTKTAFADVQNQFFRLFTPVKLERQRLPTSLPEFSAGRLRATLSDSPVTAAAKLGGHWEDHNLACILHLALCNLRCSYCYVPFELLAGKDSFWTTPAEIVDAFVSLASGSRLPTIFRISGGEPSLSPNFILAIYNELSCRDLLTRTLLKVETNATAFPHTLAAMRDGDLERLRECAPRIALHCTLHARPSEGLWADILCGLGAAIDAGFDVYPAIGGSDWLSKDLDQCFVDLSNVRTNLPLRLAVRPFNLEYDVVRSRRHASNMPFAKGWNPITHWDDLLQKRTGNRYLGAPRHEITL